MSYLIYRSVVHDGARLAESLAPCDLVYRGCRHDGVTELQVAQKTATSMCYRSVSYNLYTGASAVETPSAISSASTRLAGSETVALMRAV
jgi:hypothetical protein